MYVRAYAFVRCYGLMETAEDWWVSSGKMAPLEPEHCTSPPVGASSKTKIAAPQSKMRHGSGFRVLMRKNVPASHYRAIINQSVGGYSS